MGESTIKFTQAALNMLPAKSWVLDFYSGKHFPLMFFSYYAFIEPQFILGKNPYTSHLPWLFPLGQVGLGCKACLNDGLKLPL